VNDESGGGEMSAATPETHVHQSLPKPTAGTKSGGRESGWPDRTRPSYWWDVAIGRARQMDKLRTEIETLREQIPFQCSRSPEDSTCNPSWARHMRKSLDAADKACQAHRPASGWVHLHNAEEWRVEGLTSDELLAMSLSLERELVKEVTTDDRIAAAYDLVRQTSYRRLPLTSAGGQPANDSAEDPPKRQTDTPDADNLMECNRALIRKAVELRGQYEDQRHLAMEVAAARRLFLLSIGIVFLFVAFAIARKHVGEPVTGVGHPWVVASAVVAGALGSITSAIQRLASDPHAVASLNPGSFTSTLTRPFIGSIAALTVFLAVDGGVLNLEGSEDIPVLILASFAAGFTERLIVYQGTNK
jgi:hypothetical protein